MYKPELSCRFCYASANFSLFGIVYNPPLYSRSSTTTSSLCSPSFFFFSFYTSLHSEIYQTLTNSPMASPTCLLRHLSPPHHHRRRLRFTANSASRSPPTTSTSTTTVKKQTDDVVLQASGQPSLRTARVEDLEPEMEISSGGTTIFGNGHHKGRRCRFGHWHFCAVISTASGDENHVAATGENGGGCQQLHRLRERQGTSPSRAGHQNSRRTILVSHCRGVD